MIAMATVLADLRADPEAFLRHYQLMIAGGPAALAGVHSGLGTFRYSDSNTQAKGVTTGLHGLTGIRKDRPRIMFTHVAVPPGPPPLGANEFNAWYIAMAQLGAPTATTHFALPGNAPGSDIALTSQLSGCTFGIGSDTGGGTRLVSHIQPVGPAGDPTGRNNLHAMTLAGANNQMDAVFERENRPAYANPLHRATIIGLLRNQNWHFYAQTFDALNNYEILKVERLN